MPATNNIVQLPAARMMQAITTPAKQPHSTAKLAGAGSRYTLVAVALKQMEELGWSLNRACEHVYHLAQAPGSDLNRVALQFGKCGNTISKAQISRWVYDFQHGGMDALVDNRKGKTHKEEGWELRAMSLYQRPQQPSIQWVADTLTREGFDAEYNRVRRYLLSLPTNLTTHSAGRLGTKEVKLNHRKYHSRTTENLPVGFCYQLDGHTMDAYVAHPQGGNRKTWRPELTAVMDVTSRYITSFWIGEAENALNTLFALADAFVRYDHVPAMLHLDNGSGFKGKLMNDESTGFYSRFDLDVMFAIPGNAKAKGQIERWFGTMERHFGKSLDSYCGADMAPSIQREMVIAINKGKYTPITQAQFIERLRDWIDWYHHRPHRGLGGRKPADVWAELQNTPLVDKASAIVLPRRLCPVRRGEITFDKRIYRHDSLFGFEGRQVIVEYSVHTDEWIRVLSEGEVWICDAKLYTKKAYIPDSRIEEGKQTSLKAKIRRTEKRLEEERLRAAQLVGHDPSTQGILELESQKESGTNAPLQHPLDQEEPEIVIDLTNWTPARADEGNNQP